MEHPEGLFKEDDPIYRKNAQQYTGSHALAEFRESPILYRMKRDGEMPDVDRTAFRFGRGAHTLILEGRKAYNQTFAIGGPVNPKTGKCYGVQTQKFKEWVAGQSKQVLTEQEDYGCKRMAHAIASHVEAANFLKEGTPELVGRTKYCSIDCQIRLDWFHPKVGIVDLKTCNELKWFTSDIKKYGYIYQLAFYQQVLRVITGINYPVHIVAVEKKEPYLVGVWKLTDETLGYAQSINEMALGRLKVSEVNNDWPTGYEDIREYILPN